MPPTRRNRARQDHGLPTDKFTIVGMHDRFAIEPIALVKRVADFLAKTGVIQPGQKAVGLEFCHVGFHSRVATGTGLTSGLFQRLSIPATTTLPQGTAARSGSGQAVTLTDQLSDNAKTGMIE